MKTLSELLIIAIGSAIVNNVVLSQFLGICPFLGVSKKVETATGMGGAVVFVITLSSLYKALGVYLPLITTNCAVLGVALTNVQKEYSIIEGVVNGIGTSVGFLIAIVIMAGIREKMEYNDISESFQGTPIVLITACLMAIAFCGFSGLI